MQATGSSYVGLESTNNSIVMMAMMLTISAEHIDSNIDVSIQQSMNNASVIWCSLFIFVDMTPFRTMIPCRVVDMTPCRVVPLIRTMIV